MQLSIMVTIFKNIVRLTKRVELNKPKAFDIQTKILRKLILKAKDTAYGKEFGFNDLYFSKHITDDFRSSVPAGDYLHMYKWWERCHNGEPNVTWPGNTKYFALSSGTTDNASKFIPVTQDMISAIKRASVRQILSIARSNIPVDILTKDSLMVAGSTDLQFNGVNYAGDLSGITTSQIPFWFQPFAKPAAEIKSKRNWEEKIQEMVKEAGKWDVGMIAGVPAWIQILFEKIIQEYNLNTIHDLWPNFGVYIHGGVSFEPYRKSFEKLLGRPIEFFETYLASEGFIAYQNKPQAPGMKLLLKNGIYYEFVPFNNDNFDENGNLKPDAEALSLMDVELNKEYALLISTCSGAWRYLIGDVIKFVDFEDFNIKITGRTKHFLSLCGEHLSVDNMTHAVSLVAEELKVTVNEFTVCGVPYDGMFAHHWVIGCDDFVNKDVFRQKLDETLIMLNDDYATERKHGLKKVMLDVVPHDVIFKYMDNKGKLGAQNKFPRVMKHSQFEDFVSFCGVSAAAIKA